MNDPQRTRQIAQSTALLMVIFATTKAISLGQTFIIANVFGISADLDAYVSANRIPELIVTLVSGGALTHAFIPIFSAFLARQDGQGAWRLASHVANTVLLATLVLSAVVFAAAPVLVDQVIAPGFDAATQAQTVGLMRILLLGTLIFSLSGLASGILQSHNHFLLPALAPIMYDLGILFGIVALLPRMGLQGVAIGTVLGALGHLLIQVPGLLHYGARWRAELGWDDPTLWRVLRLMIPRIIGLGVFQFNFLIMTNVASRLGTGSVAALDWGWRLMQIPQTLIGTAMGIVIFPTLAALSELGDSAGKRSAMSGALRFIMIASIPSAVGLILIGMPLISLLERGAFDASASLLVYSTLRAFTLGLITHSMLEIVARAFYADKDTLTPLWAALLGAALNFLLAFALSGVNFVEANSLYNAIARQLPSLGYVPVVGDVSGLALANSLGVLVEVVVLLFILRTRWQGIEEKALVETTFKALAASLVMGLAVWGVALAWEALGLAERGLLFTVAQMGAQVVVGGLVFLGCAWALGLSEVNAMLRLLLRRPRLITEGATS